MHFWKKKSHTSEEGGAHLKNFIFPFIDKLWKTRQIRLLKNWKKFWRYHHFTHVYQKTQSYEVKFLRYGVRQNFLPLWPIFCPVTPLPLITHKNQNFEKMKQTSGDVIILNLCNKKAQSYNVCLLRYGMRQT